MFEYHGWATLRADTQDGEIAHDCLELEDLRKRLNALQGQGHYPSDIRISNGQLHLTLSGFPNHRNDAIIAFFRQIGATFPGSYGLLYIMDDESKHYNAFRVHRLARGKLEELEDPFLSPFIPTVEDPVT